MKKIMVGMELLKKAPLTNLLYHQKRTVKELREHGIVFNTYPTGSGKTRAAFERLKESNENTLIIAPTNEILRQHYNDAREFVKDNGLNYRVVRVDAKVISKIARKNPNRRGKILYNILENPSTYSEELNLKGEYGKVIIIVNPDIFYYCVYGLYSTLDKSNLMEVVITKFNYIIIDEFHYYNSKQLMNFLYFMALSKHLGYMEKKRKICILTATPDKMVEKYFKEIELDYKVVGIENEPIESEEYEKLKSLSKMDLYITSEKLEDVVVDYYKKEGIKEDSVVISKSILKIHKIKKMLYKEKIKKEDVGVITGVIDSDERKEAVQKKIILATTTVDIGYNFKKKEKTSQNIDTAIIEATTADEALQRIGRAGRILGKELQDKRCRVIMCVSNEVYSNIESIDYEITRQELKDLINSRMPENVLLKRYIQSGAMKEIMNPLDDLYYKFPKESYQNKDRDTVIGGFYEKLNEIFAKGKGKSFKAMQREVRRAKNYKKFINEYKGIKSLKDREEVMLNPFNDGFKGRGILNKELFAEVLTEMDPDEPTEIHDLEGLEDEEIKTLKLDEEMGDNIIAYMKKAICLDNALMNFRGEKPTIKTLIYDKYNIFTQGRKIFSYDIFHILRYYDIYFYNTKKEFLKEMERENIDIYEEDILGNEVFFIRIDGIKDSKIRIDYNHKNFNDRKTFERESANKAIAIKGVELSANEKDKIGYICRPLKEEIRVYFKEKYIPVFIVSDSKIEAQIRRIVKNKQIFLEKITVEFKNGSVKEYDVLVGSDAVLIDYEILRLKDKTEKSESFIF